MGFRWYGYPSANAGEDLDVATDVFMAAISPPGRLWNPWAERMARAEFRDRLKAASRGELVPIDEVKPVDDDNPPPMYEIRWQGISVTNKVGDDVSHQTVLVRLYHSEPDIRPGHFVGHHIHEKDVASPGVYGRQDAEIAVAKRFYDAGEASAWGIAGP